MLHMLESRTQSRKVKETSGGIFYTGSTITASGLNIASPCRSHREFG